MKLPNGIYKRTQVYKNSYNEKPKQLFVELLDLISKNVPHEKIELLDIGGAAGSFCNYIVGKYDNIECTVVESDKELCSIGASNSKIKFINEDIIKLNNSYDNKFDIITCIGVLGIIDDCSILLNKIMSLSKGTSYIYLIDHINNNDLDVITRYKYHGGKEWNIGHNIFCKKTINEIIKRNNNLNTIKYYNFELPFDLEKNPDDPVRSWTIKCGENRKLVNGMGFLIDLKIVEIKKNDGQFS